MQDFEVGCSFTQSVDVSCGMATLRGAMAHRLVPLASNEAVLHAQRLAINIVTTVTASRALLGRFDNAHLEVVQYERAGHESPENDIARRRNMSHSRHRLLILVLGPIPIVVVSLALTRWARSDASPRGLEKNRVLVSAAGSRTLPGEVVAPHFDGLHVDEQLEAECRRLAETLAGKLGPRCSAIVRCPFVIAGDLSDEQLDERYRHTIGPAARAMAASYFSTAPHRPVTLLLFSGEESYNYYAAELYGEEGISVFGYYKPEQRTLVANIGTGGGTLVHELTHALADFDFPAMPDWFNEGLASLHEQCRIRDDESGIDGLENWRLASLQQAIRQGRLRSLASLIGDDDFRRHHVELNYAQARYFCLYLQRHGLLGEFYHRFRADHHDDPSGVQTALAVVPQDNWDDLDADFQQWVLQLEW